MAGTGLAGVRPILTLTLSVLLIKHQTHGGRHRAGVTRKFGGSINVPTPASMPSYFVEKHVMPSDTTIACDSSRCTTATDASKGMSLPSKLRCALTSSEVISPTLSASTSLMSIWPVTVPAGFCGTQVQKCVRCRCRFRFQHCQDQSRVSQRRPASPRQKRA